MNIPENYQGPLRYEKIEGGVDPDIDFMYRAEEQIRAAIKERGPRQIYILALAWDGNKEFNLPEVPEEELERMFEWFHDLDVIRLVRIEISSPGSQSTVRYQGTPTE